ncbi:pyridoxamine 5\'-phosphate oxidase [Ectocarpus siliculosus]|uniref:pyridoxal 5'-phosphate synthase n=1 Tax=Ectocarpus siliculosus TaxID=2880 RepID=D7FQS6_ECTSI|nr:pyridoxamine 5\'-phosphate oxidase [Ectocarpus siliculosus]|eukprot:CBJ49183.1 pyridoxamine 5\'-phosphate oxidase [Ectocarpus siliculosus]
MDSTCGGSGGGGGNNNCGGASPRGSKRRAEDTAMSSASETAAKGGGDMEVTAPEAKAPEDGAKGGGGEGEEEQQDNGASEDGDLAALRGDLDFCKRNEGLKFTAKAMDGAAAAGHLDMVVWLHEQGGACTTDAMDLAARGGHLDIVQWLHDTRTEGCSDAALALAAGRGHLATVQWFYSNSVPGDISKAIDEAQKGGHKEVVEWLKSHSSSSSSSSSNSSSNKKSRVDPRPGAGTAMSSAEGSSPSTFTHGAHSQQMVPPPPPGTKPCPPMGMFGSPFGNFSPVNGIVLPGDTIAQKIVPKQAAAGIIPTPKAKPPASGAGGSQRLRSNMLRSPELTLATSGRLSNTDERQLKAVMEFRKAYSAQALEGSNIPKDPFTLFAVWFEEARIARASEPGAMCLSTVGPTGRPSARYVMLQGFDKRGFVWYTNFESRKSQEMSHNPYGALSFWWSEVQRAVRIEGVMTKVTEKESTEYFKSRPRGSQVGAWALHQSRPVESRGSLEANVKDVQSRREEFGFCKQTKGAECRKVRGWGEGRVTLHSTDVCVCVCDVR